MHKRVASTTNLVELEILQLTLKIKMYHKIPKISLSKYKPPKPDQPLGVLINRLNN